MIRHAKRAMASGAEVDQFSVAHHGDRRAVGYLAIGDMTVEQPGRDAALALLISGLAVDSSIEGPQVIRALMRRAATVRDARLRSLAYVFEAALVNDNPRVDEALGRAGFQRHEELFWLRRIAGTAD